MYDCSSHLSKLFRMLQVSQVAAQAQRKAECHLETTKTVSCNPYEFFCKLEMPFRFLQK